MCSGLTTMGTNWTHRHEAAKQHSSAQAPLKDSLLDAIESQRAATWLGVGSPSGGAEYTLFPVGVSQEEAQLLHPAQTHLSLVSDKTQAWVPRVT